MTVCDRMSRERVSLAELDDDALSHEMDDRAKVRQFTRALQRGAAVPTLFVIRQNGELSLIHGLELTAAADALDIEELDAIVFDARDNAEADEVGTLAFDLAEGGIDMWGSLLPKAA